MEDFRIYKLNAADQAASGNIRINISDIMTNSENDTMDNYSDITDLSLSTSPILYIAITTSLLIIISVTILGNLLVCVTILRIRSLQTTTNYFILSLSLSDLLLGCLVLPLSALNTLDDHWRLGYILCNIYISSDVMLCTVSILTLFVISVDRYIAVTRPLRYRGDVSTAKVRRVNMAVWAFSFLLAFIPIHLGWNTPDGRIQNTDSSRRGTTLLDNSSILEYQSTCEFELNRSYVIFVSFATYFAPLVVMCAIYRRIFAITRRQVKEINDMCRTGVNMMAAALLLQESGKSLAGLNRSVKSNLSSASPKVASSNTSRTRNLRALVRSQFISLRYPGRRKEVESGGITNKVTTSSCSRLQCKSVTEDDHSTGSSVRIKHFSSINKNPNFSKISSVSSENHKDCTSNATPGDIVPATTKCNLDPMCSANTSIQPDQDDLEQIGIRRASRISNSCILLCAPDLTEESAAVVGETEIQASNIFNCDQCEGVNFASSINANIHRDSHNANGDKDISNTDYKQNHTTENITSSGNSFIIVSEGTTFSNNAAPLSAEIGNKENLDGYKLLSDCDIRSTCYFPASCDNSCHHKTNGNSVLLSRGQSKAENCTMSENEARKVESTTFGCPLDLQSYTDGIDYQKKNDDNIFKKSLRRISEVLNITKELFIDNEGICTDIGFRLADENSNKHDDNKFAKISCIQKHLEYKSLPKRLSLIPNSVLETNAIQFAHRCNVKSRKFSMPSTQHLVSDVKSLTTFQIDAKGYNCAMCGSNVAFHQQERSIFPQKRTSEENSTIKRTSENLNHFSEGRFNGKTNKQTDYVSIRRETATESNAEGVRNACEIQSTNTNLEKDTDNKSQLGPYLASCRLNDDTWTRDIKPQSSPAVENRLRKTSTNVGQKTLNSASYKPIPNVPTEKRTVNLRYTGPPRQQTSRVVSERKATITVATILLAFMICWVPYFVLFTLKPFGIVTTSVHIDLFVLWLGYLNSSINPFLYAFHSPAFHRGFRKILCPRIT